MVDLSLWNLADIFTAKEAAALIRGVDPSQVDHLPTKDDPVFARMEIAYHAKKDFLCTGHCQTPFASEITDKEVDQMLTSQEIEDTLNQLGFEEYGPFLRWLSQSSEADFANQHFTRQEISRWLGAIGLVSKYEFTPSTEIENKNLEASLSQKEPSSLLKMIIGMAIEGYGYKPSDAKSPIPKQIADDCAKHGVGVSDDTVRKYLAKARHIYLPKNTSPS